MKKTLILLVSLFFVLPMMAEKSLIGRWQSEPINEGTEKAVEELTFIDSTHLELAFITDNNDPMTGRMVTRMSVKATYQAWGPMFFVKLDLPTVKTKIEKLELTDAFKASMPAGYSMEDTKKLLQQQAHQQAKLMFSMTEEFSMIYITHEENDTISFIIGDENDAMDLVFHRMK